MPDAVALNERFDRFDMRSAAVGEHERIGFDRGKFGFERFKAFEHKLRGIRKVNHHTVGIMIEKQGIASLIGVIIHHFFVLKRAVGDGNADIYREEKEKDESKRKKIIFLFYDQNTEGNKKKQNEIGHERVVQRKRKRGEAVACCGKCIDCF